MELYILLNVALSAYMSIFFAFIKQFYAVSHLQQQFI